MKRNILFSIFMFLIVPKIIFAQPAAFSLSLEEVTRLALENNFEIQLLEFDAKIAKLAEGRSLSIYDTIVNADIQYRDNQRAQASPVFGTKVVNNNYNFGISRKSSTGTKVSVNMNNERESTNSTFTSSPLIHDSTLALSIEQSLGRNFFGKEDRGNVEVTLVDIENADYLSIHRIENLLADVQKNYWDLALQQERVAIELEIVEQAKRLYDLNQEKLEDGLSELPEFIASEANYKTRTNELKLLKNDHVNRSSLLKLKINREDLFQDLDAVDLLVIEDRWVDGPVSLQKAFQHRRDYKVLHNTIKQKNILVDIKKNNIWPEINLKASLERNGLGDHFPKSIENITDQNNPDFFAGISFEFPLENRQARADLEEADLEKAKSLIELKYLERTISVNVMNQVRECNVRREVALNEISIAELQKQKLEEELKRYNAGRSDTDTIIRFQEDVLNARLRAAQSKFEYRIALIDLELLTASLLTQYLPEA